MSQGFGLSLPAAHVQTAPRPPARFLVLIEAGGSGVVRLFLQNHELVAEFDAGSEEASQMMAGLPCQLGAEGPEWDRALAGHSAAERRAACVYTLDR